MKEYRILSPSGIVGYGFPEESFRAGVALKPDLILKHPSLRGMIGELGWIIRKKLRLFDKYCGKNP